MPEEKFQELTALFGGIPKVAELLGVRETAVYNWRTRGVSDGTKWRLHRIAKSLGVTLPTWFFDGESEAA